MSIEKLDLKVGDTVIWTCQESREPTLSFPPGYHKGQQVLGIIVEIVKWKYSNGSVEDYYRIKWTDEADLADHWKCDFIPDQFGTAVITKLK